MKSYSICKFIIFLFTICLIVGLWFLHSEIYSVEYSQKDKVSFEVSAGEDVSSIIKKLNDDKIIKSPFLFKIYLRLKGIDKKIKEGNYILEKPITLARVAESLKRPSSFGETTITIIPGWNLRDVAQYFEREGMFQAEETTEYLGLPGFDYRKKLSQAPKVDLDLKIFKDKPRFTSYEGYLAPDTYRIFKNATLQEVYEKIFNEREKQITSEIWSDIEKTGHSFFEILTMASIVEREANNSEDMALVADIFWRRNKIGWALQSCATVNYITGKNDPGISDKDRQIDSPYNTYKYPGLPLGPIGNPSMQAIKATIYPTKNDYWYFMTDADGKMRYGKTLEEHNANVAKYLR